MAESILLKLAMVDEEAKYLYELLRFRALAKSKAIPGYTQSRTTFYDMTLALRLKKLIGHDKTTRATTE